MGLHVRGCTARLWAIALLAQSLGGAAAATTTAPDPPPNGQSVPLAREPAASPSARDVLSRVSPAIVQIQGFVSANTAHAFHGTAFAVAAGGRFMTNYHVVAPHVRNPSKYRLEYRAPDGSGGAIRVLAIDVRNDLAIVEAAGYAPPPLKLDTVIPAKGERAYAIGFPLAVGLTITEGVANGLVDNTFGSRIHYSGALNSGMSGGPALDSSGNVIGINVSAYRFQQLVSFLVPAQHGQALLDRVAAGTATPDFKKDTLGQLRDHAASLLESVSGAIVTQAVAGYTLPARLAPYFNCNATADTQSEIWLNTVRISCSARAGVYVQSSLTTGDIDFHHVVLSTDKLDAWRFANRLAAQTSTSGRGGTTAQHGPFACDRSTVRLKGFDADMTICARGYRSFEGLYDVTLRIASLNARQRGFVSQLHMTGMEYQSALAFVRRYVSAMEWQP